MSISGSQEVKTAIFNSEVTGSSLDETLGKDAQEDREILGYEIDINLNEDVENNTVVELYVGTDPVPPAGAVQDNEDFYIRVGASNEPTTGLVERSGQMGLWFGHGSGIEWNEDATMNCRILHGESTNDDDVVVTVFYREL